MTDINNNGGSQNWVKVSFELAETKQEAKFCFALYQYITNEGG